ncbi:uncharacterized protein LOC131598223 [Vicia villosa]|uniref:uncharacterized protein LOC131598223 n=1 Tax=Vicia villosa TaxID=3911 RepID=UPI00273C6F0E|nr:uncharacterized protein LOC131598223 [Vicia villosa]
MEKWKDFSLSKEEEEGVVVGEGELFEDESLQRTLAGKLWTESNFNSRAFKSTMLNAWKLKHTVEVQDLNKNLFIFKFSSKRDMEYVLKTGPWSFDRALLVLKRISGEEQPSDLDLHFSSFWVRIYDLPLILRSETMARKLGNIIGTFEEMDVREAHRNGRFMRLKVNMDLKEPLKHGTIVSFKDKKIRVHFKYERLPIFCFICGRMGHQIKDCEAVEELNDEGFEDIEEQDLAFGQWLRASPLPKLTDEFKKRESSSSLCSRELFNASSSQSQCEAKGKDKGEDLEVHQTQPSPNQQSSGHKGEKDASKNNVDVETVAETLGAVMLSTNKHSPNEAPKAGEEQLRKWTRRKPTKQSKVNSGKASKPKIGKRQLVDVMITEGPLDEYVNGDKKRKQAEVEGNHQRLETEVVLDDQHRLHQ